LNYLPNIFTAGLDGLFDKELVSVLTAAIEQHGNATETVEDMGFFNMDLVTDEFVRDCPFWEDNYAFNCGILRGTECPRTAIEFHSLYGRMLLALVKLQEQRVKTHHFGNDFLDRAKRFESLVLLEGASYHDLEILTLGYPSLELFLLTILFSHGFTDRLPPGNDIDMRLKSRQYLAARIAPLVLRTMRRRLANREFYHQKLFIWETPILSRSDRFASKRENEADEPVKGLTLPDPEEMATLRIASNEVNME